MKTLSKNSMLVLSLFFLSGHAYSATDEVGGAEGNNDIVITDNTLWTTLRTVTHTVNGGVGTNDCMVVASADVAFPNNDSNETETYNFVITRNLPQPGGNLPAERTLIFVDNKNVQDPLTKSISTNTMFTGLTSTNGTAGTNLHTFYLLGRKGTIAPNATVKDSGIHFACVDR